MDARRADVKQRQIKNLNNRIESDHAPIKKLIMATGGFKSAKRAWSTLKGFETLRKLNKGQFDDWLCREELDFGCGSDPLLLINYLM